MWCKAVVLCCLVAVALGAVFQGISYEKPYYLRHKQGCYIPERDDVLPYGQKIPSRQSCMEYLCDYRSRSLVAHTCPSTASGSGSIILPADLRKPYPRCCVY